MTDTVKMKNDSSFSLGNLITARNMSFVVLIVAILISGYLSYLKFENVQAQCSTTGSFDCGAVLNSIYSEVGGVPIAYLGLITNFVVVALLLAEPRISFFKEYGPVLIFGVVLFAFLFSMYLIYIQAVVILKFCPYCLTHEALITVLFALSGWRFWQWLNRDFADEYDD